MPISCKSLSFVCVFLCATNILSSRRVAIILESEEERHSFSEFLSQFEKREYETTFYYDTTIRSLELIRYGELVFDHLVLFHPTLKNVLSKQILFEFLDNGGNILMAASQNVSRAQRMFALECGVEFEKKNEIVMDHIHSIPDASDVYDSLIETKDVIPLVHVVGELATQKSMKPIAFQGIGMSLDKDSILGFHILKAPRTAYSANPLNKRATPVQHLYGDAIGLVTAIQARNNARIVFSGSIHLFRNTFFKSNFSNAIFAQDITKWNFQETGVLRIENVSHFRSDGRMADRMLSNKARPELPVTLYSEPEIARNSLTYRVKDLLYYAIQISQLQDGHYIPFQADDVQLEFVMLDPYVRKTLKNDNGRYHITFQAPDQYGIFQFRVLYRRHGFTTLYSTTQVSIRPYKHDEFERFIPAAMPYYLSAFSMMFGVFVFSTLFLFHKEKKK